MYSVFNFDAQDSTHPIVISNVVTPSEANAVFDSITYNKGMYLCELKSIIINLKDNVIKILTTYESKSI
jgi:aminopeptidase N